MLNLNELILFSDWSIVCIKWSWVNSTKLSLYFLCLFRYWFQFWFCILFFFYTFTLIDSRWYYQPSDFLIVSGLDIRISSSRSRWDTGSGKIFEIPKVFFLILCPLWNFREYTWLCYMCIWFFGTLKKVDDWRRPYIIACTQPKSLVVQVFFSSPPTNFKAQVWILVFEVGICLNLCLITYCYTIFVQFD